MLPKAHRLIRREDFARVFKMGAYSSSGQVSLKLLKTTRLESRIGFSIGKNFSKKAALRNRAKRVLRNATYQLLPKLKPGYDIVVMMKPSAKAPSLREIQPLLENACKKANLFT